MAHTRQQELLKAGDRVGVAVSGGIDSVALLRLLLELRRELGIVLSVVHFNHKLRGAESEADQEFVAGLARQHELELHSECGDVAQHAAEAHVSLESAARELRYGFFRYLLTSEGTSWAKAPGQDRSADRGAGSAAPPKADPQGRKPLAPKEPTSRGAEAPLYHSDVGGGEAVSVIPTFRNPRKVGQPRFPSATNGAAESRALSNLDKIATGHTLDDQAETVLMRLVRGTGLKGLSAIYPRIPIEDCSGEVSGEIVRPLIGFRRCELERYLKQIDQPWREDSTNPELGFTRNRMRQRVLPVLEREFNPSVAENLAELAEIARGEEDYWENEIAGWLGTVVQWSRPEWARATTPSGKHSSLVQTGPFKADLAEHLEEAGPVAMNASVSRAWLLTEPMAVQRRLVKAIGEHIGVPFEFKHVEEILRFAAEDGVSGKELSLPLGWKVGREPESLTFLVPDPHQQEQIPQDYEYELPLPGSVFVPEASVVMEAVRLPPESQGAGYNREQLLDPALLCGPLKVRNWRPGDRFWPAHAKSPKKIKELLQQHHVVGPARRHWPVVASGDEIVWLRGFPPPAKLRAKQGREAVLIRGTTAEVDSGS